MLFFTPEGNILLGDGFSLFGWQHLLMLAVLGTYTVLSLRWMCRLSEQRLNRLLRVLGGVMLGLEVLKDFILAVIGAFSIGYLPLHLCSLAMFVCLYYGAHPRSNSCGQILYSVCFPGAMCALLFPDWTMLPILHFQSLHSFLYHTLLVQVSLAPVVTGRIRPGIGQVWKSMTFLVLTALFNWIGFAIGLLLLVLAIAFTDTAAGKNYLYPLIPFNRRAFLRLLIRRPIHRDNT